MSNYINRLLSRNLMQPEIIRPRLPSLFEPITIPYIPRSEKWDSEKAESSAYRSTKINKPLNELKEEIFPASEFLEKHKNQSKSPHPKEIRPEIEDVPTKSKPVQQETNAVESTWIKPTELELSQSKFSLSEGNPLKPAYPQKLSLFKPSADFKEKEPIKLDSDLKPIQNRTFHQNTATKGTPLNIHHFVRQDQAFKQNTEIREQGSDSRQFTRNYALIQYRHEINKLPKGLNYRPDIKPDTYKLPNESNFDPTANLIVPRLLENETVTHTKPLKSIGSVVAPYSVWDVKTKAETEQPAIAEQPVIRVSIGRIEVKAVTQTSLPQKRENKPQAPKLSLNDYLNSRNGGRI